MRLPLWFGRLRLTWVVLVFLLVFLGIGLLKVKASWCLSFRFGRLSARTRCDAHLPVILLLPVASSRRNSEFLLVSSENFAFSEAKRDYAEAKADE